jgi:ketosteroid isomerase-like protein
MITPTSSNVARRLACFLFLLLALPHAFGEAKPTPDQQQVINLHNTMREAARRRDFDAWSPYVADDCIFTTDDGDLTTKQQIIQHMRNLPLAYDRSEDQRDFVVHIYADTAVLNLRFSTHEQFTDTDIVTEMRETETFVRQASSWLLVARQWESLPINFRKPATADPARYRDYVGEYEWRPGGPVDAVAVKGAKLLTRLNDESEENEYLPLGHETFFLKDDLGTVTFVRNPQGRVSGYVYRRADGQEIHVKKTK